MNLRQHPLLATDGDQQLMKVNPLLLRVCRVGIFMSPRLIRSPAPPNSSFPLAGDHGGRVLGPDF